MKKNEFTPRALQKLVRVSDRNDFPDAFTVDFDVLIADCSQTILSGKALNVPYSEVGPPDKRFVVYPQYHVHLLFRALSRVVARRFRVRSHSRDTIIRGVIESLSDASEMYVMRRDVSSFYESMPITEVRERLLFDTAMPRLVRHYLEIYFSKHCGPTGVGLPRGIGLSATLAELIMEGFDKRVREIPGVYRYSRFADDVLAFSHTRSVHVSQAMINILATYGMAFNSSKSYDRAIRCVIKADEKQKFVEYLGYRFTFDDYAGNRKTPRPVTVTLSDRRFSRTRTRIVLSLRHHAIHGTPTLLVDRIRFLTSNYKVAQRRKTNLGGSVRIYSGVYHNHRFLGKYNGFANKTQYSPQLQQLDNFLHSLMRSSTSSFAAAIETGCTPKQRQKLRLLSFQKGFEKRVVVRLSHKRLAAVKEVWKHV